MGNSTGGMAYIVCSVILNLFSIITVFFFLAYGFQLQRFDESVTCTRKKKKKATCKGAAISLVLFTI